MRLVEDEVLFLRTVIVIPHVVEQVHAETGALYGFQEPRRNGSGRYLCCDRPWHRYAREGFELSHFLSPLFGNVGGKFPHVGKMTGHRGGRGHGEADQMGTPAGPWRPWKFRLDVEADRSPGSSMSPFMPRHIEQPGSRQSKPASVKIASRPSDSACSLISPTRHDHRVNAAATLRPWRSPRRRADPRSANWCRTR